jgi:hypothetical protein
MKERGKIITIILLVIIFILVAILCYGIYTGFRVKAEINSLQSQIQQLNADNSQLTEEKDNLQKNYDLLVKDVANIYKTCMKENTCKGRYPGISWLCNNVGDEVSDPSHTCSCDSSCNLKATQLS